MATTIGGVDWKSAPSDYAALFQTYFPFMVNLVAKNGIDENHKEDVAADIFLRLIEKGFLEQFDPDRVFEYQGEMRPARFKSFLGRAVTIYVRGHYDKIKRHTQREVQICDIHTGEGSATDEGTSWADLYGDAHADHADDVIDMVGEEHEAEALRRYLARCPKRSVHDTCDLVEVYNAVREQLLAFGEYDVKLLQRKFGISTTTMHNWLWWLKENMAHVYGREVPPKRRRVLRTKAAS